MKQNSIRKNDIICMTAVLFFGVAYTMLPDGLARHAAAGALIGGVLGYTTNWLVVRMLFRPRRAYYLPSWLGGYKIPLTPGLLIAKQQTLASNIGETVSKHLLSPSAMREVFEEPSTRQRIEEALASHLLSLCNQTYAAPASLFGVERLKKIVLIRDEAVNYITQRTGEVIGNELSAGHLTEIVIQHLRPLATTPLSRWITVDHRERLATGIGRMLGEKCLEGDAAGVQEEISQLLFSHARKAFENEGLAIIRGLANAHIPRLVNDGLDDLGTALKEERCARSLRQQIVDGLSRGILDSMPIRGLPTGFSLMAEIGREGMRELLERMLATRWDALVDQLLADGKLRNKLAETICGKIETGFSTGDWSGISSDEKYRLNRLIGSVLSSTARDFFDHASFRDLIYCEMSDFCRKSVADWIPDWEERADTLLRGIIGSKQREIREGAMEYVHTHVLAMVDAALFDTPVGCPVERFGRRRMEQICGQAACLLTGELSRHLETIVQTAPIENVISCSVNRFQPADVESTVRSVADTELHTIVALGGYLGMLAGSLMRLLLQ